MNQPLNLHDAILNLQKYLRAISFVDSRITRVPLDGIFDTETQQAVREYQSTRELVETGIVDKLTWDTLFDEYMLITEAQERTQSINFFPSAPTDYEATVGDESIFISVAQMLLRELSVIYDGFPNIEINGIFDDATEEAVKTFQEASLLSPTGRIDNVTWNRLSSDFNNYSASR